MVTAEGGAQGLIAPSAGTMNRAVAGASVALASNPSGSLYWNPATMSQQMGSRTEFSVTLGHPTTKVASSVPADAFGPGSPAFPVSGVDRSDSGVSLAPNWSMVYAPEASPFTLGVGAFSAAGVFSNLPSNPANPVLNPLTPAPPPSLVDPAPPAPGSLFSSIAFTQFASAVACQVTPDVAVAAGPLFGAASLQLSPSAISPPDDADGDSRSSYPDAVNTRLHWGLGFYVGATCRLTETMHVGASYKSPQWYEDFRYNSAHEAGLPRELSIDVDLPQIVSLGLGYTPNELIAVTCDLRYIDYRNTDTIGDDATLLPTGQFTGLGYQSVWALATGVRAHLTRNATVGIGYLANTSPFPDEATFFNIGGANILTHGLFLGGSLHVSERTTVSVAYSHGFRVTTDGPIYGDPLSGGGPIPGSTVAIDQSLNAIELGVATYF